MAHCININTEEFKTLLKEIGGNPISLAADIALWQEKNGLDNFPTSQDLINNVVILPTDKIIWGHPGLGKTTLREKVNNIIDFDSDYKPRINKKFNLEPGHKARMDWRKNNEKLWNEAVRELWKEAKEEAKKTNKILVASDMILLREFANDFDKVITMPSSTFTERSKQRNDYKPGDTEDWKNKIDIEVSKIPSNKVITTNKYFSDLLPSKQQNNTKISINESDSLKKLGKKYLVNSKGFFSKNVDLGGLRRDAKALGYQVAETSNKNGYYLKKDGKKVNFLEESSKETSPINDMFPVDDVVSNKAVIDTITENGTELEKEFVNILSEFIDETTPVEFTDDVPEGALGSFEYVKGKPASIKIKNDAKNKPRVYIHELTHEATVRQIEQYYEDKSKLTEDQVKAVENIIKVFIYTKNKLDKGQYGFKNVQEFVAEAFSNREFQNTLNSIEYKNSSVLSKFLEFVAKLLGLDKNSALSEVLNESFNLMQATTSVENLGKEESVSLLEEEDTDEGDPFKYANIYNNVSQEEQDYYAEQINSYEERTGIKPTKKLKATVEKLLGLRQKVKLIDDKYIDTETSEVYQRATEVLSEDPFYKFEGIEADYDDNREWGNQIDYILRGVLLGKNINEIKESLTEYIDEKYPDGTDTHLNDQVINKLVEIFTNFKNQYPDSIILTQQLLYNEELKTAGTVDVVIVNPNGEIKLVDLKSSVNPTGYKNGKFETYTTSGGYENAYNRRFKKKDSDGKVIEKASRQDKHEAQLSIYKGLGISKGLIFVEENSLEILPIHISDVEGSEVIDVEEENIIPLSTKKEFVEDYWSDENYSEESNLVKDSRYDLYVNQIKKLLNERLEILQRRHTGTNKYEKAQIERLQKAIETVEKTESLNRFINQLYDLFVKNQKTSYPGLSKRLTDTINKVERGELVGMDAINELQYYRESVNLYENIVEDLAVFYDAELSDIQAPKEGSMLFKLQTIQRSQKQIKSKYKAEINPLIARELSKYISESANKALIEDIEGKKKRMEGYKKIGTPKALKIAEKLEKEINKLSTQFKGGVSYETILQELNEGADADLSLIDTWNNPAISSSNSVVALFAKLVKNLFEEVRMKSFAFAKKATIQFENYKKSTNVSSNNTAEFNKGMYEKIKRRVYKDGEFIWQDKMAFVQEIDVNKYQDALSKAIATSEEIRESQGDEKARIFMDNWYYENTEKLDNGLVINGVVIRKGFDSILEEKKALVDEGVMQEFEFVKWYNENTRKDKLGREVYMRELSQPKKSLYTNQKYLDLQKDPAKLKYYEFLISQYFDDQSRIPAESRMGYVLPSIPKSKYEMARQNGVWNYLSYRVKDAFSTMEKDNEIYGDEVTSKDLKVVPLLFHNNMPADDVSLDLISSVMRYHEASLRYEAQNSLVGISDATLQAVKESAPVKTTSLGKKIISAAAKKAGIDSYLKYQKDEKNNIATLLEGFIDMQIYGKTSSETTVNLFGKEVNLGKAVNTLMGISAFTQIGGNPLLSAANYLTAASNASIEAFASQFFSQKEYQKARLIYDKHVANGDFIKDFGSPIHKTLIGQIIDLYDPLQGKFKDKFGRKISHTTARKLMSTDTWFFMQHQGEHNVQVRTLIAMLLKKKVMINGEEKSLLDAYELDSEGNIKLKDGVKLEGNISSNGLIDYNLQNSLHAINKQMHGVYDEFSKTIVEKEWWGRLLVMYRKFVVPGFKRRYKRYGIDQEMGTITEGYYRTFWNLAINETKELLKAVGPFGESNLTPLEQANAKRALAEMGYMLTTGIIIMSLAAKGGDDDDDDKLHQYSLYFALRLNNELGFFLSPGDPRRFGLPNPLDMYKSFRSPTAGYSLVEKAVRLASQLSDPTAVYERDTGAWKKGDNKLLVKFYKLLGYTGNTANPDEAINILLGQTQ